MKKMKRIFLVLLSIIISAGSTDPSSVSDNEAAVSTKGYHPMLAHFFNGSYEVRDVLKELINNKSLTKIQPGRRSKREDDCLASRLFGGYGGTIFRDPCSPDNIGGIIIRSGAIINAVQVIYTNNKNQQWVPTRHGGTGGKKEVITLYKNEYIVAIVGSHGRSSWCNNCINELGFITENENGQQMMHGPYGNKRGNLLIFVGQFAGSFGRSGRYLDALGCYYQD